MTSKPTPRLYSRRELPSWLTPAGPDDDILIFYGWSTDIREFVFAIGQDGVRFWEEWRHTAKDADKVPTLGIPEDVMIAAGVEAKRRASPDPSGDYWRGRMSQRMPKSEEAQRLTTILRGHAYESELSLRDQYEDKRPYGNKDIPVSIAFALGWDRDRVLCREKMPAWVQEEAMAIHRMVGERLK